MITTFQFARLLAAPLRGAAIVTVWPDFRYDLPHYRVTGRMDTGVLLVPIEIHVWRQLEILKLLPPAVWCREPWMRSGADWHNSRAAGMCWVLRDEWRDAMAWKGKTARAILEEGRNWIMNAVPCLINRHYHASLEGLTEWPKEWLFWSHCEAGAKEYQRERRLRLGGGQGAPRAKRRRRRHRRLRR